ncbi:hypothetical protein D9M68_526480 [compost metagenome]
MAGFTEQVGAKDTGPAAVLVDQRGAMAGHVEVLDDAKDLRDRDAAGGGRRHAAHLILAIGGADRRALPGLVVGQVVQRGHAGRGVAVVGGLDLVDDGLGDRAVLVEGVGAVRGDGAEHIGQRRVLDGGVDRARGAVGIQEIRRHFRIALDIGHRGRAGDRGGHAWRDGEAVRGQLDGRREQLLPRLLAVFAVGQFEHPQRAGGTDRAAAAHRVGRRSGRVGGGFPLDIVLVGAGRSGLAAIVGRHRLGRRVVIHDEGAAADAGGLRLDQVQHHLCRDRGIDGGAAVLEHVAGDLGRERVVGHRHIGLAVDRRLGRVASGLLGRARIAGQYHGLAAGAAVQFAAGGRGRWRCGDDRWRVVTATAGAQRQGEDGQGEDALAARCGWKGVERRLRDGD